MSNSQRGLDDEENEGVSQKERQQQEAIRLAREAKIKAASDLKANAEKLKSAIIIATSTNPNDYKQANMLFANFIKKLNIIGQTFSDDEVQALVDLVKKDITQFIIEKNIQVLGIAREGQDSEMNLAVQHKKERFQKKGLCAEMIGSSTFHGLGSSFLISLATKVTFVAHWSHKDSEEFAIGTVPSHAKPLESLCNDHLAIEDKSPRLTNLTTLMCGSAFNQSKDNLKILRKQKVKNVSLYLLDSTESNLNVIKSQYSKADKPVYCIKCVKDASLIILYRLDKVDKNFTLTEVKLESKVVSKTPVSTTRATLVDNQAIISGSLVNLFTDTPIALSSIHKAISKDSKQFVTINGDNKYLNSLIERHQRGEKIKGEVQGSNLPYIFGNIQKNSKEVGITLITWALKKINRLEVAGKGYNVPITINNDASSSSDRRIIVQDTVHAASWYQQLPLFGGKSVIFKYSKEAKIAEESLVSKRSPEAKSPALLMMSFILQMRMERYLNMKKLLEKRDFDDDVLKEFAVSKDLKSQKTVLEMLADCKPSKENEKQAVQLVERLVELRADPNIVDINRKEGSIIIDAIKRSQEIYARINR